ncbi:MAG TPA: dihydropyrimidinase [Candidatus Limnocylindria bacterium]|nr:dihydropyrimidinase [Candidatus Limnocylindria bacterium]
MSPPPDLVIRGGSIVTPGGTRRADVAVTAGRVSAVGDDLADRAAVTDDATGMVVLPGVVDVHTHLRLPVPEEPDRFLRDTAAAARGGTTTVLSFNNPGTGISDAGAASLLAGMREFRERTAGQAAVDIGLNAVVTGGQARALEELPALIEAGVPTFKAFMVYDFRLPDDRLEAAMRVAARHGGMLQVHCEEPAIIDPLVAAAVGRGETGCRHHMLTRPPRAEGAATRKAIAMARRVEAPLYIVHLSCEEALEAVAEAKGRGEPVYAETCPHYLALTDALYDADDEAEVIKRVISPPLRSRTDVEALWAGLREGQLDVVASDHVPDRLRVEKQVPAPPFPEISNGGPGIETLLAVLWSEGVARGRLAAERLVELLAATPARLFGLPDKGRIEVGADADLVVFDPDARGTITQAALHHTSDYTPFEGLELRGRPVRVYLRGRQLGTVESGPIGRFVERMLRP